MKTFKVMARITLAILFLSTWSFNLLAQCETWNDNPRKGEAEDAHVLYRDAIKAKNFKEALKHWQKVFEIAPAADGRRDYHFSDGIDIYKHYLEKTNDQAKKKEYVDKILALYEQGIQCLENGAITLSTMSNEDRVAFYLGRMAFDMFYHLQTPYPQTLDVLKRAIEKGGNKTEYIVLDPYAHVVVNLYNNDQLPAEEARQVHQKLNDIADYNIENNQRFAIYFQQAKDAMNATFGSIEKDIFDCDYFKNKFQPEFKANPADYERLKEMYATLVQQGCPENDPFVQKLDQTWKEYADKVNAERMAQFLAENPGVHAKQLYDEGDYKGAIEKYEEAIGKEADQGKIAEYYFGIASIKFRKLGDIYGAKSYALKAADAKPGWGRPYMLIGDIYVKSSASCGTDAYERGLVILAALNKYAIARQDPEWASDAKKRINKYSGSVPPKEDVHMRGTEGQAAKVPCWGETVTVKSN